MRNTLLIPRPLTAMITYTVLAFLGGLIFSTGQKALAEDAEADDRQGTFLELHHGDRVCLIGNTLAERMQHFNHFETLLHAGFPEHRLVVRNLAWSADELKLKPRSQDFGNQDSYLTAAKADVIFAFFGFNESFAGPKGLPKFEKDLADFINHARSQKYNGKSAPHLVLISPIAHEDLGKVDLPDGQATNKNLALYTKSMADVADRMKVSFVDLFTPSKELMGQLEQPLTMNGIHLNDYGSKVLARVLSKSLFGDDSSLPRWMKDNGKSKYELLRTEIAEKNLQFWYRYRAVNGFYIYGGRADLWENRKVMETERKKLDEMTAVRDRRVWQIANGKAITAEIDDSGTTQLIDVPTNYKREITYLSPEESRKKFSLAEGYEVNLFASEVEFPELRNPVQMTFDAQGRLWVCTMPSYPQYLPPEGVADKLLILEDTDGDGKADKRTVFADNLHVPTGFELGDGGVYIAQQPNLLFLEDTDGDDVADERRIVLHGFDSGDTHHAISAFTWGPGGALYFQEGTFHHTQVETPRGPVRLKNAGVFRYEPRSEKLDVFVSYPFANPWGHIFDHWGQNFVADASGGANYFGAAFSGYTKYGQKHRHMQQFLNKQYRPTAGCEIVSSRNFPEEVQGNYLLNNCIGFLGIAQYKFKDAGSGFHATPAEILLRSSDPNFRPVDLEFGPDGALYFVDWYNPLVGHMQHSLRDPKRDHLHGRVWRMRYTGRPLVKKAKIAGASTSDLVKLLESPEDRTRYRVRRELRLHDTKQVTAALQSWMATIGEDHPNREHLLLEALWVHQHHNVVNETLLKQVLRSPEAKARAAATRVLCYWRDRVEYPLELLKVQAADEHPRVRLEAVRAASFFADPAAEAVVIEALLHPLDYYLKYTLLETMMHGAYADHANPGAKAFVKLLKSGRLPKTKIGFLVQMICKFGDANDLTFVFQKVIDPKGFTSEVQTMAMASLRDTAKLRKLKPSGDLNGLMTLILDRRKANDVSGLLSAIELTEVLGVKSVEPQLISIALAQDSDMRLRRAAVDVLVRLGSAPGREAIERLTSIDQPLAVRVLGVSTLAEVDLEKAAKLAAGVLAGADASVDPSALVKAFLDRQNGAVRLAVALANVKLHEDVAKLALRYMYSVGRSDAELSSVLTSAAGISAELPVLGPKEIRELAAVVLAKGDAARGEQVFRRADLSCMTCHAVSGAGGQIGPDLSVVGSSSPIEYLINAVYTPAKEVKEEYVTAKIYTVDGKSHSGIIVEEGRNRIVLKDATGKKVVIPRADLDEEPEKGGSLMPSGLVRFMTHRELVDLLRFLSELGKPGGEYAVHQQPTIQRWRVLSELPGALGDGVPKDALFQKHVLSLAPSAWKAAYGMVAGLLPLDETVVPDGANVVYLQAEVNTHFAGKLGFELNDAEGLTVWVGDKLVPLDGRRFMATLPEGRQKVTLRVDRSQRKDKGVKMQFFKPEGSKVRASTVRGA